MPRAGQAVIIELGGTTVRVIGQRGEPISTVARDSTSEVTQFRAYGTRRLS